MQCVQEHPTANAGGKGGKTYTMMGNLNILHLLSRRPELVVRRWLPFCSEEWTKIETFMCKHKLQYLERQMLGENRTQRNTLNLNRKGFGVSKTICSLAGQEVLRYLGSCLIPASTRSCSAVAEEDVYTSSLQLCGLCMICLG